MSVGEAAGLPAIAFCVLGIWGVASNDGQQSVKTVWLFTLHVCILTKCVGEGHSRSVIYFVKDRTFVAVLVS